MSSKAPGRAPIAVLALALALSLVVLQALLDDATGKRQHRLALRELSALAAPVDFDNDPFADVSTQTRRAPGLNAELVQTMPLRADGHQVGLAVDARARGYLGDITVRATFAADGRVLGARVLDHRETAGLGDRLVSARWLDQFVGRKLDGPGDARSRLRRDGGQVDQLTGATVTSRAALHALLLAADGAAPAHGESSP